MAAKKKSRVQPASKEPSAAPLGAPAETGACHPSLIVRLWAEARRYPSLSMAVVFLVLTAYSITAVIQFRENMNMGAIREPTGSVFLGAISLVLFGSYWRQRRGANGPSRNS